MNTQQDSANAPDSNGSNGNSQSCFPLNNLSPEEITLTAALFAIALGQSMEQEDASLLAFFLSTVASNLGIFLEKRRRDVAEIVTEPPFPGEL